MFTSEDKEKALTMAKIDLMREKNTTFVSTVMCSLDAYFDDSIPTAATNGKYVKINSEFFMALPEKQRVFLLAHETMHVVYMHMLRRGDRDAQKFNIAADYVINLELVDQGIEMIPGGLIDPIYKDLSTEQVYDLLPDDLPNNPMDGDISEEGDPDEAESIQTDIDDYIVRAVQMADLRGAAGSVPSSIRNMLDELAKPKVNWRVTLKRFMLNLEKSDYSWNRPNKRYSHAYMPSIKKDPVISTVTFAFDMSGSVTDEQTTQFMSEVKEVFKVLSPKKIELLQFDHRLQGVDTIRSINDMAKVEFKGYGGTAPEVAIEHFMTTKSKVLIVLTDGYFNTSGLPKPKQPVIWVILNNEG